LDWKTLQAVCELTVC